MRLKREKNLKKLNEAKESAEFWRSGMNNYLNEMDEVQGAVKKAEHRQQYSQIRKLYFKDLKEVKKRGRLLGYSCLLYTSPSPRDATLSRMPSSA